jgi:hypothetical protein
VESPEGRDRHAQERDRAADERDLTAGVRHRIAGRDESGPHGDDRREAARDRLASMQEQHGTARQPRTSAPNTLTNEPRRCMTRRPTSGRSRATPRRRFTNATLPRRTGRARPWSENAARHRRGTAARRGRGCPLCDTHMRTSSARPAHDADARVAAPTSRVPSQRDAKRACRRSFGVSRPFHGHKHE